MFNERDCATVIRAERLKSSVCNCNCIVMAHPMHKTLRWRNFQCSLEGRHDAVCFQSISQTNQDIDKIQKDHVLIDLN